MDRTEKSSAAPDEIEDNDGKPVHTIGILTSGGDAPGMNAVVRSVVRTALLRNIKVKGVLKGYSGLIDADFVDMDMRSVSGILEEGGTRLFSARCPEFKTEEGLEIARKHCIEAGIDGLVVCGGDGTFRGAKDLSQRGVPCVGIPATIDNDIASTDYCVGFDTAVNTVVQNIDKLRDTSESHQRCSVVEVMGRNCGDIALHSAICCGAVSVLVPEIPYDLENDVIRKMQKTLDTGKSHFIVIVAEGVTRGEKRTGMFNAEEIAKYIQYQTGVESRATVIGHVQRGGSPSSKDRVIASRMGHYAVSLLKKGIGNRVLTITGNKISDMDIREALQMKKDINHKLVRIANEISI